MGTWGVGNLESDDARECLDQILDGLAADLSAYMNDVALAKSGYLEQFGLSSFMPTLDVMVTLCAKYHTEFPVEMTIFKQWRSKFLAMFDVTAKHYFSPEFTAEKRGVIERTFDEAEKFIGVV